MKLAPWLALLVLASCSSSSNESGGAGGPAAVDATPAITGVGAPIGEPVTQTIGPAGGALASPDGKLQLVVPAGALAADTAITMTPIEATGPGAFAAWRFGPEGTTFATPATLRFAASAEDLAGSEPDALRIGTQRADGAWEVVRAAVEGNAITAATTHFSDWSIFLGWKIEPGSARVKTGQTQRLDVRYCRIAETERQDDLVGLVSRCEESELAPLLGTWAVNGVAGGSAEVGTVAGGEAVGTYTAPSKVPSSNPVAVSVDIAVGSRGRTQLVSNIEVFGGGYSGTFAFTTTAPTYTIEATAGTVDWELTNESSDRREYRPSGSVKIRFVSTSPACDPVEGVYPIEEGDLAVYTASSPVFPSQYHWNVRLTPDVTLSCRGADGQPFTTAFEIPGIVQVGFCDGASPVPYTAEADLSGSGACPLINVTKSEWSFKTP